MMPWFQRWPTGIGYAAAVWCALYGCMAIVWNITGNGFPFGIEQDPNGLVSIFASADPSIGIPVAIWSGFTAAALCLLVANVCKPGWMSFILLSLAWSLAAGLCLLVPDYRILVAIAYAPIALLGAPFDWPPGNYWRTWSWPVVHQLICMIGGGLVGATALVHGRRIRQACLHCGRTRATAASAWTSPDSAAKWGKWAVYVSFSIPVFYAVTRWAWALGIPLGVSSKFLADGAADGFWFAGAMLGTLAVAGGSLAFGLIRPWGEVFPRRFPGFGGKRLPVWLAFIPAFLMAVVITMSGIMYVRLALSGFFGTDNAAAFWPELLWPI